MPIARNTPGNPDPATGPGTGVPEKVIVGVISQSLAFAKFMLKPLPVIVSQFQHWRHGREVTDFDDPQSAAPARLVYGRAPLEAATLRMMRDLEAARR
jgi:hypothetical protein